MRVVLFLALIVFICLMAYAICNNDSKNNAQLKTSPDSAIIASNYDDYDSTLYIGMKRLKRVILAQALNLCDSLVIDGLLDNNNNMLLSKFDASMVRRFYDSIYKPDEYFTNMKKAFGWSFIDYAKNVQIYIEKKNAQRDFDTGWCTVQTNNFNIYFKSGYDSTIINNLGHYLETEFININRLLAVSDEGIEVSRSYKSKLIKSFYPHSDYGPFFVPDTMESTGGKIQIILLPRNDCPGFRWIDINRETGGRCFSEAHMATDSTLYLDIRIEEIFGGYLSFPFITQELAHAIRCIYQHVPHTPVGEKFRYNDIGINGSYTAKPGVENPEGRLEDFWTILEHRARYLSYFDNELFETAISYYSIFSTGIFYRCGMIPPTKDLLSLTIRPDSRFISDGIRGWVDFGLEEQIGSAIGLGAPLDKKIETTIFALADFLRYLHEIRSPKQMHSFLSYEKGSTYDSFESAYGDSLQDFELRWNKMIIGHE
jgi:hypothetical protein